MRQAVPRVFLSALLLVFVCLFVLFHQSALAEEQPITAQMNERLLIPANTRAVYAFTPTANNIYTIKSFGDKGATATLTAQGYEDPLAKAAGFEIERRLVAGQTYLLTVETGGTDAAVEFMRAAFGRCYERPIEMEMYSSGYGKLIARSFDTHWYRFVPEDNGIYTVSSRSGLDMTGYLLDADGAEMLFSDDLFAPYDRDFRFQAELIAGKAYYIRVAAKGDETGEYLLYLSRRDADAIVPERITLSAHELSLNDGGHHSLGYTLMPLSDEVAVRWTSSDPAVASVDWSGEVSAVSAGEAQIIAWVDDGVYDICRVAVEPVHVESLTVTQASVLLNEGQVYQIPFEIEPRDASNQKVYFASDDTQVASVDQDGLVTAVSVGETAIHLATEDGNLIARIELVIEEALPVYRALLLGEQQYTKNTGRSPRVGSVNSTQGMADMLSSLTFQGGNGYQVTMRMDSTRADAIRRIRWTFRGAKSTDVSLFYLNCHGEYIDGVAYLEFHDGSRLTAGQLERELRKVRGTVVVIIDCCQSGSFLSTDAKAINDAVIQAFGQGAAGSFAMSKYRVLTSTGVGQDSFRMSYSGEQNENAMYTVFARSLCEAGGWDLIRDKRISMKADLDKNRAVTLYEAYLYTRMRVRYYIETAEMTQPYNRQDVQVYPEGAAFVLFERE